MKTKRCTNPNCLEKNPQSLSNFRNRGDRDGKTSIKRSQCISCEKVYQSKNGEKIRERTREWQRNNKERRRDFLYQKLYGINLKEYERMFKEQNGECAICSTHQSKLKQHIYVDHCHVSGKIRGLLCFKCNRALGLFNDDISRIKQAIQYLKK